MSESKGIGNGKISGVVMRDEKGGKCVLSWSRWIGNVQNATVNVPVRHLQRQTIVLISIELHAIFVIAIHFVAFACFLANDCLSLAYFSVLGRKVVNWKSNGTADIDALSLFTLYQYQHFSKCQCEKHVVILENFLHKLVTKQYAWMWCAYFEGKAIRIFGTKNGDH